MRLLHDSEFQSFQSLFKSKRVNKCLSFLIKTLFSLKTGETNPSGKTWASLVSYVDDLTVGGRRNSQGEYDDPMSFPSFGHNKRPKIPQDCFPHQCYEQ